MAKTSDLQKMFERGKKQIRKVNPAKSNSWGSNMLKSLGYSSLDVVKNIMPNVADITESAIETSKELREQMIEGRSQNRTLRQALDNNVYVGIGKDWFKNALEDLKSGNLNNKARAQKVMDEAWGFGDDFGDFDDFGGDDLGGGDDGLEDFDSDDSWGDDDWGDSFEDDITSDDDGASASFATKSKNGTTVTQVAMTNNIGPDSPIVQATQNQTEVLIKSSEINTNTTIASTQALMQLTSKIGTDVTSLLASMGDTVSDINSNVTKIVSEHQVAAMQYYSDSMGVQNSILEEIKGLRESINTQIASTTVSTLREKKEARDVMNMFSSGMIDVGDYKEFVMKNIKAQLEGNFVTSSIMGMASDTDQLKQLAANPLGFVTNGIIKGLIPNAVKASAGKLDEMIGNFLPTLLTQIGSMSEDYSKNWLQRTIGSIFGIQNKMVTKIDQSNYEKGPVPWDGIARRTLTDVIPMYLSQIASAVTGTEQMAFDYETGTYKPIRLIQEDRNNRIENAKTAPFFEDIMQFNEMVNTKYTNESQESLRDLKDTFRQMIINHVDAGGGTNYRVTGDDDKDTLTDYLAQLTGLSTGDPKLEIIRGFFEGRHAAGDNAANAEFFGRRVQDAIAGVTRSTEQAEKDATRFNTQYLNNGMERVINTHIKTYDNGTIALRGTGGPFADKYGKRPAEYLRDILARLNKGILVEITNPGAIGGRGRRRRDGGPGSGGGPIRESTEAWLKKTKLAEDKFNDEEAAKYDSGYGENTSYEYELENGRVDTSKVDQEGAKLVGQEFHTNRIHNEENDAGLGNKPSLLAKVSKYLPPGMKKLVLSWDEGLQKMGNGVAGAIQKSNNFLYSILFGSKDVKGFMKTLMANLRSSFAGFKKFMFEKILLPADEALFGEDGIFTKIEQSEFMKDMKNAFSNVKEKVFGTPVKDENGKTRYEGGLLSDTFNELRNMGSDVKRALIGGKDADGNKIPLDKDDSVLGSVKKMGKQAGEFMAKALGIDKKDESEKNKPLGTRVAEKIDDAWGDVKDRFSDWADTLLGPKLDDKGKNNVVREAIASVRDDMEGQGAKVAAGAVTGAGLGTLGVLGGLFVPGGPIGAAIVGAGVSMVKRSETLQNLLFGPKDEDGKRTGGLINKEVQDFFKDNKTGIKAGAFTGLAASLGFIPSFFVPGGPVGGAIIGGALSMATKTQVFQEFLYGKDGTKDDPTGGLKKKVQNIFGKNKDTKDILKNAGTGAGVGLIGSFFLPGGPILGALMGSAISIGVNTEKFKTFMFGEEEFDEEGKSKGRKGGLFGKVTDFVNDQIFKPLMKTAQAAQIKMIGFVEREMIAPLLSALSPITNKLEEIGLDLKNGFNSFFRSIGEKFNDMVTRPIGEALQPYIDKMKQALSKIFGGIFKAIGAVISSPFKMIGAIGTSIFEGDKKRGANAATNDELRTILDFKGRKERGEKMGLFNTTTDILDDEGNPTGFKRTVGRGLLSTLVHANSKEVREAGAYSDRGAGKYATKDNNPYTIRDDYIAKSKAKEAERLAKLNGDTAAGKSPLDRVTEWLKNKQTAQGPDNSRVTSEQRRAFYDAYDSFNAAGIDNPGQMALDTAGISTNNPSKTISKLLKRREREEKKNRKKGKGSPEVGGEGSKDESKEPTTVMDAVKQQTETSTEQHKETTDIITTIRDKVSDLVEKIQDVIDKVKDEDDEDETKTAPPPQPTTGTSSDEGLNDLQTRIKNTGNGTDTRSEDKSDDSLSLTKKQTRNIADDVSRISDSVYGQLNGVGSNINKIYRLLLRITDTSDDDIKGDNNKEYVGFFGKIRTMLNNPIKAVMNVLMTPVRLIEGAFNKIGSIFSSVGNFLASTAKGIWHGVKDFGSGILQAGLSVLQLPVELAKMAGTVLKNALPVVKETLVSGLKIGTTIVTEGVKVLGTTLIEGTRALGTFLTEAASGFGQLLGGALSGLGNLLAGAGLIGKEVLKGVAKGVGGLFRFVGGAITGTLKTGATIVGNILGGLFGKGGHGVGVQNVWVVGGTLDEVTYVESDDPDCQDRTIDNFNEQTNKILELLERIAPKQVRDPREGRNSKFGMNLQHFGYKNSGGDTEIADSMDAASTNISNAVANGMLAVETAKLKNQAAQDAKAKEKEEYETRVAENSAKSQNERAEAEEAETKEDLQHKSMMDKFSELIHTNKEHHSGWAGVFGLKKGVITLGLLAAIPLLIKLWPLIKGAITTIGSMLGSVFTSLKPILDKLGIFLGESGKEFVEQAAEGAEDVGGIGGMLNNFEEASDDMTKAFSGEGNEVVINKDGTVNVSGGEVEKQKQKLSLIERVNALTIRKKTSIDTETGKAFTEYKHNDLTLKAGKALLQTSPITKKFTRNAAATVAKEAVDPVIDGFVKMAKPMFTTLGDDMCNFLIKHGIAVGALTTLKTTFKEWANKLFSVKILGPFLQKISKWMGSVASKTAAAASTLFLSEGLWFTIGAIVANPAQVFHVNKKDVDAKMQIIARFFEGLLGTSLGSLVDFAAELIYSIFGVDLVCVLATAAYNCFGSDAKEKLKQAQDVFKEEYRAYVQKEYEAYAKLAEEKKQDVLTLEQFKQSELATSEQQYVRDHNRNLVQRAGDATLDGLNAMNKAVSKVFHGSAYQEAVARTSASGAWQRDEQYGGFGGDETVPASPSQLNGIPYFSQNDPAYQGMEYNLSDGTTDTIANRGCGPTAMAMIGKAQGKETDPIQMSQLATKEGYSTDIGTDPKFFNTASKKLGIASEEKEANKENLATSLVGGSPILIQGRDEDPNSPFTAKGHYIVGTKMTGGGIAINDPRGPQYSGVYPLDKVAKGASKLWTFNGGSSIPSMEETISGFGGFGLNMDAPELKLKGKVDLASAYKGITAEKVVKIAAAEVGYIEKASNGQLDDKAANPGNANYTKYNQFVGSNPQYWCAAFVCWVFNQACDGDYEKFKQVCCGGKSAACNTLMSQFKSANRFDKNPKIGDHIFFSGSRHSGANHIGIVVGIDNQYVYTIEGNTSGNAGVVDNGGEVAFKSYQLGDGKILGYGHPVFDAETSFAGITNGGELGSVAAAAPSSISYSADGSVTSDGSSSGGVSSIMGFFSTLASNVGNAVMEKLGFKTNSTDSTAGTSALGVASSLGSSYTDSSGTAMRGNNNTEKIWNYFKEKGFTKEGIAGLMGNMQEESGFEPTNLQDTFNKKFGMTDDQYTTGVDNGSYGKFGNDSAGYGLVQWTYGARKKKLLDYKNSTGKSIGDLGMQLDFLNKELQSDYPSVYNTLKTSNNVQEASDVVLTQFEKPADQSQDMKNKRGGFAKNWYEQYKNYTPGTIRSGTNDATTAKAITSGLSLAEGGFGDGNVLANRPSIVRPAPIEMRPAPIRRADNYGGFGSVSPSNDKIVDILGSIANDTSGINSGIGSLNDKELPTTGNTQNFNIIDGGNKNNVTNNNISTPSKSMPFQDDTDAVSRDYSVARKLAQSLIGK